MGVKQDSSGHLCVSSSLVACRIPMYYLDNDDQLYLHAVESVLVSCAKIINELLDDVWAKAPRSSV